MFKLISFGLAGTPRPPLHLSLGLENGQFTVRWEERDGWKHSNLIKKLYTVIYCTSLSKKCKVCCPICDHLRHITIIYLIMVKN